MRLRIVRRPRFPTYRPVFGAYTRDARAAALCRRLADAITRSTWTDNLRRSRVVTTHASILPRAVDGWAVALALVSRVIGGAR